MTTCIITARYSPRRNGETSESNAFQIAECRKHAERNGWDVAAVFEDEMLSGDDLDRPGLWSAIEALKKGWVLLAWKYDRLDRSPYIEHLIRQGVERKKARIEVVVGNAEGDSPEEEFLRGILAQVRLYEKRLIGLRTSAAMRHHQRNGRAMSKCPPYGCREGNPQPIRIGNETIMRRTWEDDPDEQAVIVRIRHLQATGWNPHSIARLLNEQNVPARGKRWHQQSVVRILERA